MKHSDSTHFSNALTDIKCGDCILHELVGVSVDPEEVDAAQQSVRQAELALQAGSVACTSHPHRLSERHPREQALWTMGGLEWVTDVYGG